MKPMEWLQVIAGDISKFCPVVAHNHARPPSLDSPTSCRWQELKFRQSGGEHKARPQIKATTLVIPTFHLWHLGNV